MKLATTTGDFGRYMTSQQDAVRWIAQSGFKYADYNFCHDYNRQNGIYTPDWRAHIEDVQKTAQEVGITFVQAHAPMGRPIRSGRGTDYYNAFVADTIRSIEACGILGIDNLVVHSDYRFRLPKAEALRQNREFYYDLLPTAEKWGVNLLIENFNKMEKEELYWIDNPYDLLTLIEMIDHPLCHACWDAGHANMQELPQDEALRVLGSHVRALHVQDNPGNSDAHIAPFFGSMSVDALMHGLNDIGYKGYFTFEACSFFSASRRPFEKDTRLLTPPLELMLAGEKLLYEIGKHILTAYDCFEE